MNIDHDINALNASSDVFRRLSSSQARLESSTYMGDGFGAAIWSNERDAVTYQQPEHHALSCYLDGGYDTRRLAANGALTGGAPGKLCLLPADHYSQWQVAGELRFIHLYFSQKQLGQLAVKALDVEPRQIELQEQTFVTDPYVEQLCRQVILPLNWQDRADKLALSSVGQLLLIHLLKHYSNRHIAHQRIRGGLAPAVKRRVMDYIEAHLEQAMTLGKLAAQAGLSEYHFARMFKQSLGMSPHHYVTARRIAKACHLLRHSPLSLAEIAVRCGFSSQSHLSNRFKVAMGVTPRQYRLSLQ